MATQTTFTNAYGSQTLATQMGSKGRSVGHFTVKMKEEEIEK